MYIYILFLSGQGYTILVLHMLMDHAVTLPYCIKRDVNKANSKIPKYKPVYLEISISTLNK